MKILEFSAPSWCFLCRQLAPRLKEECEKHNIPLDVYDMDTDEGAEMAERYGIKSVPTIIAIDDSGVEIGRDYGSLAWKSVEFWLTRESLNEYEKQEIKQEIKQ